MQSHGAYRNVRAVSNQQPGGQTDAFVWAVVYSEPALETTRELSDRFGSSREAYDVGLHHLQHNDRDCYAIRLQIDGSRKGGVLGTNWCQIRLCNERHRIESLTGALSVLS
jgi:hypothetical protein